MTKDGGPSLIHLPTAYLILDAQHEPLSGSRKGFSVFGIRLRRDGITEERLSSLDEAIASSDFGGFYATALENLTRPGSEASFRWTRGDRIYDVRVSQLTLEAPTAYGIVLDDVTRQVQFEQTRETARRFLEDILNNVHLGVVVLNDEMRVTSVNRAQETFWSLLGVNVSWVEAIGKPISDLVPAGSDEAWDRITRTVVQEGRTHEEPRRRYATASGDLILSVAITPLRDQAGKLVGAIQVSENVTDRVQLEEELREAEVVAGRLEAVRETAITVNHEINNPLTTILAIAQVLLMSEAHLDEKTRTRLETVEREVKRIAEVTQRLQNLEELKRDDYIADGPKMIDLGDGENE